MDALPAVPCLDGLAEDVEILVAVDALVRRERASGQLVVAELAADAAALIDAPTHVVGASLGAAIAIELALAQFEKMRTLTVITPFVQDRRAPACRARCLVPRRGRSQRRYDRGDAPAMAVFHRLPHR
jgi:surfactin synthase thioesterase subunit